MSMLGVEIERIWMSSSSHRSVRRLVLICGLVLLIYVAVLGQWFVWDKRRIKEG